MPIICKDLVSFFPTGSAQSLPPPRVHRSPGLDIQLHAGSSQSLLPKGLIALSQGTDWPEHTARLYNAEYIDSDQLLSDKSLGCLLRSTIDLSLDIKLNRSDRKSRMSHP